MNHKPASMEEQEKVFDGLWQRFSRQVANDEGWVDFPSRSEQIPLHLTTVMRLPKAIAEKCSHTLKDIHTAYPEQYYYPPAEMHFTLLNLDKLFTGRDEDMRIVADAIEQALIGLPPLRVKLAGIGLFPTSVFAQVYDVSGALELYRSAIKEAAQKALAINRSEVEALVKDVAFVNLCRFKQVPSKELVKLVAAHRNTDIGTFTAGAVELVKTDKLFSASSTLIKRKIQLKRA